MPRTTMLLHPTLIELQAGLSLPSRARHRIVLPPFVGKGMSTLINAFTPELRPTHAAPVEHIFSGLPEAQIEPTFAENLGAALALINSAGFDAPAAKVKVAVTPGATVVQVVRSCWKAFEGWAP